MKHLESIINDIFIGSVLVYHHCSLHKTGNLGIVQINLVLPSRSLIVLQKFEFSVVRSIEKCGYGHLISCVHLYLSIYECYCGCVTTGIPSKKMPAPAINLDF